MPFVIPSTPVTGPGTPGHQFSAITLNDADGTPVDLHRTDSRHIYAATGLIGVTPPRQVVRPRPSAHGSINNTRNTEGRLIVLEGRLLGEQSATDMFTEFYTVAGAMLETLDYGEALLKWTIDGGASMQAMVKLHGELEPPVEVGPNILAYQAQLFAQDPRAYSSRSPRAPATRSQARRAAGRSRGHCRSGSTSQTPGPRPSRTSATGRRRPCSASTGWR
jgi:hypothetical protein